MLYGGELYYFYYADYHFIFEVKGNFMKVLRVFIKRTSQTPIDNYTTIGFPSLFLPQDVNEVHISTIFSWDIEKALKLKRNYEQYYPKVLVGGPAFADGKYNPQFTPGLYVKRGITITTRGCNFKCPFCLVDKKEGKFIEVNIEPGNTIQDNNILLASRDHLRKVFQMLKTQKGIRFVGGLDKRLLKDWHIEELRSLKIKELWLAFDNWDNKKDFVKITDKLKKEGFTRHQIRCYVLAGFNEPIQASEERLRFVYECGAMPFIQKYRDENNNQLSKEDSKFIRQWSRPAIIKANMNYK